MDKQELDILVKRELNETLSSLDLKADEPLRLPAGIVSWLTMPLICPVYGAILIFTLSMMKFVPTESKWFFILMTFGINCLFPVTMFALLKSLHVISDIGLNKRKERLIPYLISVAGLVATAILYWYKGAPDWVVMFFIGGAVAGIIEMVVNIWWKISVHAAGVAGLVAMLVRMSVIDYSVSNMQWWIAGAILLTGLLGTCRVYLRRHTVWQVIAGMACGYACVYLCMLINI